MTFDEKEEIFVKLSSNSTSDFTYVHWGEDDISKIELFDQSGKLLTTKTITSTFGKYEISGVKSGKYYVKLSLLNREEIVKKMTLL